MFKLMGKKLFTILRLFFFIQLYGGREVKRRRERRREREERERKGDRGERERGNVQLYLEI